MYIIELSKNKAESMVEHLTKATECLNKAIKTFNEAKEDSDYEYNERLPRRGRDYDEDDERYEERYGRRGARSGMRGRYSRY